MEEFWERGFIHRLPLNEKKPTEAEQHLLQSEQIISTVMGIENDYAKTVYRHLYSLYAKWNKPELAEKYKEKLLQKNTNNAPYRCIQ